MPDVTQVLRLFHSMLRWLILLGVGTAGIVALVGYLRRSPIIVWERSLTIVAMVLCHIQLLLGLVIYGMRFRAYNAFNGRGEPSLMNDTVRRFWKFEHIGMMILAIALVTIGRVLSKRANTEQGKQIRIAIFYLLGLIIMLMMIPWPFTVVGRSQALGWF